MGAHSLTVHASRSRVPSVPLHVDPEWAMKRRRQEPPWLSGPAVRSHTRLPLPCSFRASHRDHLSWSRAEHLRLHLLGAGMSKNRWTHRNPTGVGASDKPRARGCPRGVDHHGLHVLWQPVDSGQEGSKPETHQPSEFSAYTHCHIQFSIQQVFYFVLILLFFEKEEATEIYWHWEMGSKLYVSLKQPTNQPTKPLLCLCSVVSDSFVTPLDSSPPGSSVHGILQASILGGVAIPFSRGSSRPSDQTHVFCISCIGRQILYHCAPWEAPDITIDSSDIHYELKF